MSEHLRKQKVLIVDDVPENIDVLSGLLEGSYQISAAVSGIEALEMAQSEFPPDIILLDVMMPEMDGFEVCNRLKKNINTRKIPVIFVTAANETVNEEKGFQVGGVDYITKPINPSIVTARVKTHLNLYDQNRLLEEIVKERTRELEHTRFQIIQRLGRAAEYKDNETGLHVIRMSKYSQLIALAHGLSEDEAQLILNASPMHDIGKIGVPDYVLLKAGKLNDEEWKIMRRHCEIGASIIGEHSSDLLKAARLTALNHHEKWDGSGYPRALKGEEIHLYGRIVAYADVFDALTSERPYKKAWPIEKAVDVIKEDSGSHFDPSLLPAFLEVLPDIINIKKEFSD